MGTRGLVHGCFPTGVRGLAGHRAHLRGFEAVITGVTNSKQVKIEINGLMVGQAYNHSQIAEETLDTDNPTGGTNFNINAAGTEITVVGHDCSPCFIVSDRVREDASGVVMLSHCHLSAIPHGHVVIHATNAVTGADIDFTKLANGIQIIFAVAFITDE